MSSPSDAGQDSSPAIERRVLPVLGAPIDVVRSQAAVDRVFAWASRRESRIVCFCNAHSVVTAAHDERFMHALALADLAAPDGAPVAWMLRRQGAGEQRRVSGPDLMLAVCERAEATRTSIFLYGSTQQTLHALSDELRRRWPALRIAGLCAPPFRALTEQEDVEIVQQINASGAGVVWVSLGCPKQELWMAAHKGRVHAVMLGVGAAFEFHAGVVARAPSWMRATGLEWLHRLLQEPRRLWRRYLVTNTAFVLGAARQLLSSR